MAQLVKRSPANQDKLTALTTTIKNQALYLKKLYWQGFYILLKKTKVSQDFVVFRS
jgi:hypothetical protein